MGDHASEVVADDSLGEVDSLAAFDRGALATAAQILGAGGALLERATGYAKEMSDDYKAREVRLYAEQAADVDIIVTTALIPGRPAPTLITSEMVASMNRMTWETNER